MKPEHIEYLASIGVVGQILARVEAIEVQYRTILGEIELRDIFVSDMILADGNRSYDSLWLFYDDFVCEAKKFILEDDFDFASYRNAYYWQFNKISFDLREWNENSRASLHVNFENDMYWDIKAAKNNCMKLYQILKDRIVRSS